MAISASARRPTDLAAIPPVQLASLLFAAHMWPRMCARGIQIASPHACANARAPCHTPPLPAVQRPCCPRSPLRIREAAPWRRSVSSAVREAEYLWTTVGYVLWPSGARRLLEALPVDQPVDNFMSDLMSRGRLRGYAIVPPVVKQAKALGAALGCVRGCLWEAARGSISDGEERP